ncbi:MAG: DMT family transporter [Acetobacteraceae bacterium]
MLTRDAHERLSGGRVAGIGLGVAGVVVIMGPAALAGLGLSVLAQAAVIGASVSYGFANIFGRRLRAMPSLVAAAGQVTATAVMLAPIALMVDRPWRLPAPAAHTWAALAGLAVFCTVVGYILFFAIIRRAGATNVSLVTLLIPVSAIVLGSVVLGEQVRPQHVAGMALILAGLLFVDGRVALRLAGLWRGARGG